MNKCAWFPCENEAVGYLVDKQIESGREMNRTYFCERHREVAMMKMDATNSLRQMTEGEWDDLINEVREVREAQAAYEEEIDERKLMLRLHDRKFTWNGQPTTEGVFLEINYGGENIIRYRLHESTLKRLLAAGLVLEETIELKG